jgi:hypothetical protein
MSLFVNVIQIEKKLLVLLFDYFALFIGLVAQKAIIGDTGCHGFMPSCSIHFLPKPTSSQQSLRPINPLGTDGSYKFRLKCSNRESMNCVKNGVVKLRRNPGSGLPLIQGNEKLMLVIESHSRKAECISFTL